MDPRSVMSPVQKLERLRAGAPVSFAGYDIVRSSFRGKRVAFAVRDAQDVIQRHHSEGRFYELPELRLIRAAFAEGGTFFDFGANIGNHTLFAAMFLKASKVVAVEPNPLAYDNLMANVALNAIEGQVDATWLGYGVSDTAADGYGLHMPGPRNLGAARVVPGAEADAGTGPFAVVAGDTIVGDTRADFIKLDVEGMELQALTGLARTIARDRPPIFVEIFDDSRDAFFDWLTAHDYEVVDTHRRYKRCENFLIACRRDQTTGAKDA